MTPDIEAIRQFLYAEAQLLDEWRLDEWLALFEDELTYWIPVRHESSDPDTEVQHAYDDRRRLTERIGRLVGPNAFAQQPRSRLSRTVGNVSTTDRSDDTVVVRSTFLLTELRRGVSDLWAGSAFHTLRARPGDPGFAIQVKKVLLVASEEPIDNLTFLL